MFDVILGELTRPLTPGSSSESNDAAEETMQLFSKKHRLRPSYDCKSQTMWQF